MGRKRLFAALCLLAAAVLLLSSCGSKELVVRVVDSDGNDVIDSQDLANAVAGNVLGQIAGVDINAAIQATTAAQAQQTPAADSPAATDPAPAATAAAPAADTPAAEATTASSSPVPADTPAAEATTAASAPSGAPTGVSEIVDLVNTAYRNSMAQATGCARTYDYTSNYNGVVEVGSSSMLANLAQTLINQFCKENFDRIEYSTNAEVIEKIPPWGLTEANLTEANVAEATCTDAGDSWQVHLKLSPTEANPDRNSDPGADSVGKIGIVVKMSDITDNVPSLVKIEGLEVQYFDTTVDLTIDKAATRITAYSCDSPSYLVFGKVSAALVNIENVKLGLLYQQKWELSY
ncbi:MAG: hypothetical protein K6C36_00835 [Clostridia bacterium]|nr:hypothetical protein [Clostridia bacterium]